MTQIGKLDLLDNRTNQEIARLALNLHLVFKDPQDLCDPGSVLKRHGCGKRERTAQLEMINRIDIDSTNHFWLGIHSRLYEGLSDSRYINLN